MLDQPAQELLRLAREAYDGPPSELRTIALRGLIDHLLRKKQDSVLADALRSTPLPQLSRYLHNAIEYEIEHISAISAGAEITSNLFCVAVLFRLHEAVPCSEFDNLVNEAPLAKLIRIPESVLTCGTVIAIPKLLTYAEITSMSFSAQRLAAAGILHRIMRTGPVNDWNIPRHESAHRRNNTFLRFVVGSCVTVDEEPSTAEGCHVLVEALTASLRHLTPAIEFIRCACDGTLFNMLHTGHWLYQVARLEDVSRQVATELRKKQLLAVTVSSHRHEQSHVVRVGFFSGNRLMHQHCYSIHPNPHARPDNCILELSQAISRSGISNVLSFSQITDDCASDERGIILLNPRGRRITSQMLMPL